MRLNSHGISAAIALVVLVLVLTINPVLSYQFSQNAQIVEPSMQFAQPRTLTAARGCNDEGKYIGTINSIREALAQVNQHLRRERC